MSAFNAIELTHKGWSYEVIDKYEQYCLKQQQKANLKSIGRTTFTDSQRSKFYQAEFKFVEVAENNTIFPTFKKAKQFIDLVTRTSAWKQIKVRESITDKIEVGHTTANCHAYAQPGEIHFNLLYDMDTYTILHELVHCAGYMDHDVGYRLALLRLVEHFMGAENAKRWVTAMKESKIKLRFPNTETKPIHEWYKGYTRAMAMRAKK